MFVVRVVVLGLAIMLSMPGQLVMADEPKSAIAETVIATTVEDQAVEDQAVEDQAVEDQAVEDQAVEDQAAAFSKQVLPLLRTRCITRHGPEKQEGGLRLDSLDAAIKGGDQGAAIVPGDAQNSLFVKAITFADPDLQMPPKQKLSDVEISVLKQWIQCGAAWPAESR
jgi:hypothetical protein